MVAFLAEALEQLLCYFCIKLAKKDVMSRASAASKLIKIDLNDDNNLVSVVNLDFGFGMKYELKQLKSEKNPTNPQEVNFKLGAQQFLIEICTHLKEKSPVKSVFARCLKCLSPSYMVECSKACESLFQKLLEKLVTRRLFIADDAKMEYSWFAPTIVKKNSNEFLNFKKEKDRLEVFSVEIYWSKKSI